MADKCKYLNFCLNSIVSVCEASPETCDIYKRNESKDKPILEQVGEVIKQENYSHRPCPRHSENEECVLCDGTGKIRSGKTSGEKAAEIMGLVEKEAENYLRPHDRCDDYEKGVIKGFIAYLKGE